MKEKDFMNAIAATGKKQLDMSYWSMSVPEKKAPAEMIHPVSMNAYRSSQVLPTRFYKIIRF